MRPHDQCRSWRRTGEARGFSASVICEFLYVSEHHMAGGGLTRLSCSPQEVAEIWYTRGQAVRPRQRRERITYTYLELMNPASSLSRLPDQ